MLLSKSLYLPLVLAWCVSACAMLPMRSEDEQFDSPQGFLVPLGTGWRFVTQEPEAGWVMPDYRDEHWQSGKGGFYAAEGVARRADSRQTPWQSQKLWLRKQFHIQHADVAALMFWGRWSDTITIYINGVEAVHHGAATPGYRYLGMTPDARAAIKTGEANTLAVMVESEAENGFFDLALTTNAALANLPQTGQVASQQLADIPALVKSFMELHGIPAGVLAVRKGEDLVIAKGFGYMDRNFSRPTPPNAVFRLASNDKTITQDAIHHLLASGIEDPVTQERVELSTKLFPLLRHLGIELPAQPPDPRMNQITIDDLLQHRSGVPPLTPKDHQNLLQVSGKMRLTELDLHDNVAWLYQQPLLFDPGEQSEYSSTGPMLLRYLIFAVSGNLEDYLRTLLFDEQEKGDVFIARHRLADQVKDKHGQPREPWYASLAATPARWIYLDNFTALASSAPAFVLYNRNATGDLLTFGTMAGSWTTAAQIAHGDISYALFFNIGGYYDDISDALREKIFNRPAQDWQPAAVPFNYNPVLPAVQIRPGG